MTKATTAFNARHCVVVAVLTLWCTARAAVQVTARPSPPRLVNDLAGVLGDCRAMEDTLEAFAMTTSNQIVVVTLPDLGVYSKAEMAYAIGQQWGVGGEKYNNGVVVLIKPKTADQSGQAFIATGYGMEGAMTDAFCTRVVNTEMIPHFKENDYAGGVWAGLHVLMPVAAGEYSEQEYIDQDTDTDSEAITNAIIIIVIFIIWILIKANENSGSGGGRRRGGGNSYDTGTWGGGFGSGSWSSGGSSWGSGGSSWGSGGSSWEGFGGGSFGGGGGGGSW